MTRTPALWFKREDLTGHTLPGGLDRESLKSFVSY